MLKGTKKHEDKDHGKTLKHEAPRSINHKSTQNRNNTGTTALDGQVKTTGGCKKMLTIDKLHPGSVRRKVKEYYF